MATWAQSRDGMNQALKRHIIPALRHKGFSGSFPHFRRYGELQTDLLTFQFSMYGPQFVVEIAACPLSDYISASGKVTPLNKTTAHHFWDRLRLGAKAQGDDHWFSFENIAPDDENAFDAVAKSILPFIEGQAEAWWAEKQKRA